MKIWRQSLTALVMTTATTATTAHAMGPIFGGPLPEVCTKTWVNPSIATDGERVYLDDTVATDNMTVLLTGYRYDDAPPTSSFPQGEGREQVYCGCQRVKMEVQSSDPEFSQPMPYFTVPSDAPTGDYAVELLPSSVSCSSGGIRATCDASVQCIEPSLSVAPSYVVSTLERLDIIGNSEDNSENPAEMAFLFTGASGAAFGEGEHLVEWTGSFPAGGSGSSHITNADNTNLYAHVPLFVGDETLMNVVECREECVGRDDALEAGCVAQCNADQSAGRYNNRLDFGFGGLEYDSSPSKAWGVVAGIAASALACVGGAQVGLPCNELVGGTGATSIGGAVAVGVNALLEDDDDNLGRADVSAAQTANWNVGTTIGPVDLNGQAGDLSIYYRNRRVAAPRILSYSVRLKSIKITDDYEEQNCSPPNEVFINARAALHQGESQLPNTIRMPSGSAVYSMREGETRDFDVLEGMISSATFTPQTAPKSPFIYLELGVWENDADKDLMGIAADTLMLAPLISSYMEGTDQVTSEGYLTRRAVFTTGYSVQGFAGSDNHCWGWGAHGWNPQAREGGAILTVEVDVTWLKASGLN